MTDGDPHCVLGLFQDQRVRLVVSNQELQVQVDRLLTRKDGGEFVNLNIKRFKLPTVHAKLPTYFST